MSHSADKDGEKSTVDEWTLGERQWLENSQCDFNLERSSLRSVDELFKAYFESYHRELQNLISLQQCLIWLYDEVDFDEKVLVVDALKNYPKTIKQKLSEMESKTLKVIVEYHHYLDACHHELSKAKSKLRQLQEAQKHRSGGRFWRSAKSNNYRAKSKLESKQKLYLQQKKSLEENLRIKSSWSTLCSNLLAEIFREHVTIADSKILLLQELLELSAKCLPSPSNDSQSEMVDAAAQLQVKLRGESCTYEFSEDDYETSTAAAHDNDDRLSSISFQSERTVKSMAASAESLNKPVVVCNKHCIIAIDSNLDNNSATELVIKMDRVHQQLSRQLAAKSIFKVSDLQRSLGMQNDGTVQLEEGVYEQVRKKVGKPGRQRVKPLLAGKQDDSVIGRQSGTEGNQNLERQVNEQASETFVPQNAGGLDQRVGQQAGQEIGQQVGQQVGQEAGQRVSQKVGQQVGQRVSQKVGQQAGQEVGHQVGQQVGQRVSQRKSQANCELEWRDIEAQVDAQMNELTRQINQLKYHDVVDQHAEASVDIVRVSPEAENKKRMDRWSVESDKSSEIYQNASVVKATAATASRAEAVSVGKRFRKSREPEVCDYEDEF